VEPAHEWDREVAANAVAGQQDPRVPCAHCRPLLPRIGAQRTERPLATKSIKELRGTLAVIMGEHLREIDVEQSRHAAFG
jgi:hypothetical protein